MNLLELVTIAATVKVGLMKDTVSGNTTVSWGMIAPNVTITDNALDGHRLKVTIKNRSAPVLCSYRTRTSQPTFTDWAAPANLLTFLRLIKVCQRCIFYLAFQRHIGTFIRCPSDVQVTGFPHKRRTLTAYACKDPQTVGAFPVTFYPLVGAGYFLVNIQS